VVASFREQFYDTQLFWDPFTGGKFAHYFFDAHERAGSQYSLEQAHQLVEEAQLFIEACHTCYATLLEQAKQPLAVKA
jgi:sulfite reductase (ferredoxin)